MNNYISSLEIATSLAATFRDNRAFNKIVDNVFQKTWSVEIGFDRFRQDWKKAAPFAVVLPHTEEYEENGTTMYNMGLLLGVVDNIIAGDNVRCVQGLDFLSRVVFPSVISCVHTTTDAMQGISFVGYGCEFEQEAFPLLYMNVSLNFLNNTPIGGRRI